MSTAGFIAYFLLFGSTEVGLLTGIYGPHSVPFATNVCRPTVSDVDQGHFEHMEWDCKRFSKPQVPYDLRPTSVDIEGQSPEVKNNFPHGLYLVLRVLPRLRKSGLAPRVMST